MGPDCRLSSPRCPWNGFPICSECWGGQAPLPFVGPSSSPELPSLPHPHLFFPFLLMPGSLEHTLLCHDLAPAWTGTRSKAKSRNLAPSDSRSQPSLAFHGNWMAAEMSSGGGQPLPAQTPSLERQRLGVRGEGWGGGAPQRARRNSELHVQSVLEIPETGFRARAERVCFPDNYNAFEAR